MSGDVVNRPLYKKWWFWVVIGIISTLFLGMLGSCGDTESYDDYESFGDSIVTSSSNLEEVTTEEPTTIVETTVQQTTAEETEAPTQAPTESNKVSDEQENGNNGALAVIEEQPVEDNGQNYVLNTNTHKFHYPSCASAKKIKSSNREDYYGTREEVIARGYEPCKNCHP